MFPRVKTIENNSKKEFEMNFFTSKQIIRLDKHSCTGCGICTKVCPKGAIITPSTEGKTKFSPEDIHPHIPDITKCSYCGTCVYMCPFNAISMKKNGQTIEKNDLQIVEKKVVPKLEYTSEYCENLLKHVNIYLEGEVDVDWNKCKSCLNCVNVCPSGAFLMVDKIEYEIVGHKVLLEPDKCINCGACVISCTGKAIDLKITKINYSGEYKEIFWSEIVKKLKN
jgi:4Fe-4S ferredoxin